MKNVIIALSLFSSVSFALPQEVYLFNKPHYKRDGFCDRFTFMQVTGNKAKFTNGLDGICEIVVRPDLRTYVLNNGQDDGCGSIVYAGRSSDGRLVEITDNSHSTCEKIIAALIVVREIRDNVSTYLYSNP